jgi:hypothetical protein
MIKHLNFTTDLGPVKIELLDNKFVDFWVNHFDNVKSTYQFIPRSNWWPFYKSNKKEAEPIIDTLLAIIDKVNNCDFLCPLPETIKKEYLTSLDLSAQQYLNRLHRYAVAACNYRDSWVKDKRPMFDFVDYDNNEFMYLINLLNQTIHALEEYVETPNKKQFFNCSKSVEFVVNSDASQYTDVDVYKDGVDLDIPVELNKHLAITGADVWIKKDILGKDLITAFSDHDDPTADDVIFPPKIISGGFMVEFDDNKTLFNSNEFTQWFVKPIDPQDGNFPLGTVVSGKENISDIKLNKYCTSISNIVIT